MKKIRMRKLMIWGVLAGAIMLSAPPSEAFRFMVTGDTRGSDNGVNAVILAVFKEDFGRSQLNTPCRSGYPCNGDFSCDGDVDGTDAVLIKADFGRGLSNHACPAHTAGTWCSY